VDVGRIALGDNVVYALESRAGGVLLVDAGPDYDLPDTGPTWDVAVEQARGLGFGPADVRAVLVTHAHIDHAGLAVRWAEAGARVLAGSADAPALRAGRAANEAQRGLRLAELRRHGCPDAVVAHLGSLRGGRALRWDPCPPEAVDPLAGELELLLTGGAALRVLPAPGHTPGNLVGFVELSGDLFSGDTLLPTTVPTAGLHFPDAAGRDAAALEPARWPSLPPFLASVERLRRLPVRRILPGHGCAVDEPARLFDRFATHHARRSARVRTALRGGPASAHEIARALFPRLPDDRLGQAMTEVIGHLDALEATGEAAAREVDGVLRYALTPGG